MSVLGDDGAYRRLSNGGEAKYLLPVGAVLSVWNALVALRGKRRWLARLWAVLVALSCLFLLWLGFANHVIGFGANY
jgi:hypothetical protein